MFLVRGLDMANIIFLFSTATTCKEIYDKKLYVYRRFTIHYSTSYSEALFSFVDTKLSQKILSKKSTFLHQSRQNKISKARVCWNDVHYCVLKKKRRELRSTKFKWSTLYFGLTAQGLYQIITKIVLTKTKVTG